MAIMKYIAAFPLATLFVSMIGIALGQSTNKTIDFRIDIDIYGDVSKPPIKQTQTIFASGQYIELEDDTHRVTVIDPKNSRITILDSNKKTLVHLEMSALESRLSGALAKLTEEQRRWFSSDGEPSLGTDNYVDFGNERLRYRFRAVTPSNSEIATSYGDFANWSVRINALFNQTPPVLRMQLNELLISQRQLPAELRRLTVVGPQNDKDPHSKTEEIVARLIYKESLSDNDRTRIATVLKSMGEYKPLTEKEFFR